MTTKSKAAEYSPVFLYVIDCRAQTRKAACALYTDPRQVRKFYDCIRTCMAKQADVSLAEVNNGFRIEVYLYGSGSA